MKILKQIPLVKIKKVKILKQIPWVKIVQYVKNVIFVKNANNAKNAIKKSVSKFLVQDTLHFIVKII